MQPPNLPVSQKKSAAGKHYCSRRRISPVGDGTSPRTVQCPGAVPLRGLCGRWRIPGSRGSMCSAACRGSCPACPALRDSWHLPEPYLPAWCGAGHSPRRTVAAAVGSSSPAGGRKHSLLRPRAHAFPLEIVFTLALAFLTRQKRKTSPRVGTSLSALSPNQHIGLTGGAAMGTGGHEAWSGVPQTGVKPE